MRRSVTIAEPLHSWIQQIRAAYLAENEIDMSYTAAINYYLTMGLGTASKMNEKEVTALADQIFFSEEIDMASLVDEVDNAWLAGELPKIIEKAKRAEEKKQKNNRNGTVA